MLTAGAVIVGKVLGLHPGAEAGAVDAGAEAMVLVHAYETEYEPTDDEEPLPV